jgi:hypothetical protein
MQEKRDERVEFRYSLDRVTLFRSTVFHLMRPNRAKPSEQGYRHQIRPVTLSTHRSYRARWVRAFSAAFRAVCWVALFFGIVSAVFLTLRRSSDLRTIWWIPYPAALWADYHGRIRNLVAYAILALPALILYRDRRKQLRWLVGLGVLGTALEYGQLFIPTRWFEWQDIALSLTGLATAWIFVETFRLCFRRLARRRNQINCRGNSVFSSRKYRRTLRN